MTDQEIIDKYNGDWNLIYRHQFLKKFFNQKETEMKVNKKLFLCDGCFGDHAAGVTSAVGFDTESLDGKVGIEWWSSGKGDWYLLGLWGRIKRTIEFFKEGAYCSNDVLLNPDNADAFADAVKEAAKVARENLEKIKGD